MAKARKKAKKYRDPLEGKRDPVSCMYRAIKRYVEQHNGSVVVIGGIQIEEPYPQRNHVYHVSVRCLGRLPTFSPTTSEGQKP